MTSKWLKEHETEVESLKKKKRSTYKKIGTILVAGVMALFLYAHTCNVSTQGNIACMAILFAGIIVFVTMYRMSCRKGDPLLRKRLARLLKTEDDIVMFDLEMMSAPLYILKLQHKAGEIRLMEHYISQHNTLASSPLLHTYSIIKIDMVRNVESYISREQRVCDKKFNFIFRDDKNKEIGFLTVYRKKDYLDLKEAIASAYPKVCQSMSQEKYYDGNE